MPLPLSPPVLPQLARPGAELPDGEGWLYEPKWDGFRAIAFVDGDQSYLQSRNGKPLKKGETYRNPDLADMLQQLSEHGSVEAFYRGEIGGRIGAAFQKNGLSVADWNGPKFARIRTIQKLKGEGRLDEGLRWIAQPVKQS